MNPLFPVRSLGLPEPADIAVLHMLRLPAAVNDYRPGIKTPEFMMQDTEVSSEQKEAAGAQTSGRRRTGEFSPKLALIPPNTLL